MAGYPGLHRLHLAARRPRRPPASHFACCAWWPPARRSINTWWSIPSISSTARPSMRTSTPTIWKSCINHLKCAAFELPIRDGEKFGPHDPAELCRFLAEEAGFLQSFRRLLALDLRHLSGRCRQPALHHQRQLRGRRYHRRAPGHRRSIASPPPSPRCMRKPSTCTKRASIRWSASTTTAAKPTSAAWTATTTPTPSTTRRSRNWSDFEERAVTSAQAVHGDVRVNRQIVGFKKVKFYTHGKRRRRTALHAGAGDAHHRLLAAFPGGVLWPNSKISRPPKSRTASSVWATSCAPSRPCC